MRTLAFFLLALGALLAAPAQAQTPGAEPYFGCPSGQTLETAPDPRILPASTRATGPRLVVRCASPGVVSRPQCPPGMQVVSFGGADACGQGSGGVTDGSSNTTMFGERPTGSTTGDGTVRTVGATATDGSSNTTMFGESSRDSSGTGTQMGDGSVRSVDETASPPPPPASGKTSGSATIAPAATGATAVVGGKGSGSVTVAPSGGAVAVPRCTAPAQLQIDGFGTADQCVTRNFSRPSESVAVPSR